jgi:hypothetical protein
MSQSFFRCISELYSPDSAKMIDVAFQGFRGNRFIMMELDPRPLGKLRHIRHPFTHDEDELIRRLIETHGTGQWEAIASQFHDRTPRQIRDRWNHYLAPTVKLRPWVIDEDRLLLQVVEQIGPHWSAIAAAFPGRTDINLKNRWKKLQRHSRKLTRVQVGMDLPVETLDIPPVPDPTN